MNKIVVGPMQFDGYYAIKLGLPADELPTFSYRIMNEFGVYGEEMYGSIHANYPVSAYAPDVLVARLQNWIAEQLGVKKRYVRAEVLLGKTLTVEDVLDYVNGYIDALTIATGVQLCCQGHVGLYTVSRRHRPEANSDIGKFAGDIHTLRKMKADDVRDASDPNVIAVGAWTGEMTCIRDFVTKWKHMFAPTKPVVEKHSLQGYYQHVMAWANDVHIRSILHSKNRLEIALGNCWITFEQRAKTIKATFHTNASDSGIGEVRHYSAQSPKTIAEGLADVLAVEKLCYQSGIGHYSTDRRVQYNSQVLLKWFKAQAKKQGYSILEHVSDGAHVYEIMWPSGTHVMARLTVRFLHAEIEIDVGADKWNRFHMYYSTCEKEAMQNAAMHIQDSIRCVVNGEDAW